METIICVSVTVTLGGFCPNLFVPGQFLHYTYPWLFASSLYAMSLYATSLLHDFAFMTDLHQHLFSLNKRNPNRIFTIITKGKKQNQQLVFILKQLSLRRWHPEQQERPRQAAAQEFHSASQPQATITLNCVYEHLCFISTYFVHLLAKRTLRSILAYEMFHRHALFSHSRETCTNNMDSLLQ